MIIVKCDMCGCTLDYDLNGVNLDFNHYGDVKLKGGRDKEYQLCNICASKIKEIVEKSSQMVDKDSDSAEKSI